MGAEECAINHDGLTWALVQLAPAESIDAGRLRPRQITKPSIEIPAMMASVDGSGMADAVPNEILLAASTLKVTPVNQEFSIEILPIATADVTPKKAPELPGVVVVDVSNASFV